MKKFLVTPMALIGIFCISCSDNSGGMSATEKKNLDAMHAVQKAFDTKDFSKVGDYIAEDAIDHAPPQGDVKGIANIKAEFEKMAYVSLDEANLISEKTLAMPWSAAFKIKIASRLEVEAPSLLLKKY